MATRTFYLFLILLQGFYGIRCWADENDVLEPLRKKVEVAKASYPELIDQNFEALIRTYYLRFSANYFFVTNQLREQLVQSQDSLKELQKWHEFTAYKNPESPSFFDELSDFRPIRYALDYEKSVASSLKKNLEDLTLGWKNQCTNESIQKFVDWNDPKRMLPLGPTFRRTPIPPKGVSVSFGQPVDGDNVKTIPFFVFEGAGYLIGGKIGAFIGNAISSVWNTAVDLFRDKTGKLREEQERLFSELSQFYANILERKRQEFFGVAKEACHELFSLGFDKKLDRLVFQAQAHESQIASEQVSYAEAWKEIKAAYSQFLLSREEVYLKDLRKNYIRRFDQTFSDLKRLDGEAKRFIERNLGPLADDFEQVRSQNNNEAKALFKQRFWDALIQGVTQFHSGGKVLFCKLARNGKYD